MKRNIVICFLIGISFTLAGYSCNQVSYEHHKFQDSKKETREFGKFNSIGLAISAEVILVQGTPQKVELEGDPQDLEEIITKLDGATLEIESKRGSHRMDKVKIYITVENIETLAVSGSGSINASGSINTHSLNLAVSGSGAIILNDLNSQKISSAISGSGTIRLSGKKSKVDNHDIAISGSGNMNAEDIETLTVKVGISGSGTCRVFATEKLNAGVSGSGSVYYKGGATVDAGVSGSGKIRTIN